jgi:hypothetical protein
LLMGGSIDGGSETGNWYLVIGVRSSRFSVSWMQGAIPFLKHAKA